jgi:transposase
MKKEVAEKKIVRMGSGLPVFNAHAAGIDIGDTLHCVAISAGIDSHEVLTTSAFTCALHEIVTYLQANGITTVAMESTGIYWLPLYILLEEAGIEPYLVYAAHVKNVTGRKKDDSDSIWLQKLHTCGLLQKSFQPDNEVRQLRTYVRQRKKLILLGSDAVRRMQKSLELMNIKLHTVISDLLGKTGMRMLKAIIGGERDPKMLSLLCDPRIKASQEEILKSLEGVWHEEYLFLLEQAVENYEFHQRQIKRCEEKIHEQLLKQVAIVKEGDISGVSIPVSTQKADVNAVNSVVAQTIPDQAKNVSARKVANVVKVEKVVKAKKNQFDSPIATYLTEIAGVDLTKIPGISEVTALEFLSEVGIDMSKWKSSKHFAAWLNVCPNTKITGGKIISSKMMKKDNKAGQCLRQAASCLSANKSPMGDYYRTMRSRLGGKGAVVATAHKMARIIYNMIINKTEYNQQMVIGNQEKVKQDKIKKLEKALDRLRNAA